MKIKSIFNKIISFDNNVFYFELKFLGIKIHKNKYLTQTLNNKLKNLKVQNNKIFLHTNTGSYTCNPKYIAEELIRQNVDCEIIWGTNKKTKAYIKSFPKIIKLISNNNQKYLEELVTSKIIIFNTRRIYDNIFQLDKNKNQIYIQTFHGSLGIKKTGMERDDVNPNSPRFQICMRDAKQIDYLTSNGKYTTNFFKKTFWNNGKILEYGHPRNDIFFSESDKYKTKVYEYFKITRDKKILLYAPTLREDYDISCFSLDYKRVISALNEKFTSDFVVLMRLHPLLIDSFNDISSTYIINASYYPDIQELLVSSDVVITDYSSCIYDYMLTRKPGFIYAPDIEKYTRGLYYPLESTPFPVAQNNDEMIENIKSFDYDKYKTNVEEFLIEKGCIDDGHASERIVKLIKDIINEE